MRTFNSKAKIVNIRQKRKGTVSSQARKRDSDVAGHFVPMIRLAGHWLHDVTAIGDKYLLQVDHNRKRITLDFGAAEEKEVSHD